MTANSDARALVIIFLLSTSIASAWIKPATFALVVHMI
jgi:hypothetical protein